MFTRCPFLSDERGHAASRRSPLGAAQRGERHTGRLETDFRCLFGNRRVPVSAVLRAGKESCVRVPPPGCGPSERRTMTAGREAARSGRAPDHNR